MNLLSLCLLPLEGLGKFQDPKWGRERGSSLGELFAREPNKVSDNQQELAGSCYASEACFWQTGLLKSSAMYDLA